MREPVFHRTPDGRVIAYHHVTAQASRTGGERPGIVFLPGFMSDMEGSKALFLHDWAEAQGRAFLRFDYTGHGQSSGEFVDGSIGDWLRDACEVIKVLTEGPQVLVGSSMGGWIALLVMRAMPERVAGLVGIAVASDFTEELMLRAATPMDRDALRRDGHVERSTEYSDKPYIITRHLIEEGRNHLVLRKPLVAPCPVRLLQGTADEAVPYEMALRLVNHIEGDDVRAILLKDADHRLSNERELALLVETVDGLPDPIMP